MHDQAGTPMSAVVTADDGTQLVGLAASSSLPALLAARATASPDRVAWRQKRLGIWTETSWARLEARAARYAAGFATRGIGAGSRVAMIVGPGIEATAAGLGLQGMGAVVLSLHPGRPVPELRELLAGADAQIAIAEDAEQLATVLEARRTGPELREVLVVDPRGIPVGAGTPARLVSVAEGSADDRDAIDSWRESVGRLAPNGPALLALTVGGSGAPRPVTLSHANLMAATRALAGAIPVVSDDEILSYLPPSHVLEYVLSSGVATLVGAVVNVGDGPGGVLADLREVRPTVLLGVPSLWDRLAEQVEERRLRTRWLKRMVLDAGIRGGRRRLPAARRGSRPGFLAGRLSTRRVRALLGLDRTRAPLSALAALAGETADALGALGVVVRQCYGTAEASGLLTLEPADDVQPGSVGRPLATTEVRVDAEGGLFARGAQIATEALDAEGWLQTGDRASLGDDALIHLVGRSEDLIVTASGARVDAATVAAALEGGPLVRRAVVTGDGRPTIGALLELDPVHLFAWAAERSAPFSSLRDLLEWPELHRELERDVSAANDALPPEAQVREFRALPDPLTPGAEVTDTRRLRRVAALRVHAGLVEEMYRA
jgi:long-chain acyl-CoA synthetase